MLNKFKLLKLKYINFITESSGNCSPFNLVYILNTENDVKQRGHLAVVLCYLLKWRELENISLSLTGPYRAKSGTK